MTTKKAFVNIDGKAGMKELQKLQRNFLDDRPKMRDHDSPQRSLSFMQAELEELAAEFTFGDGKPSQEQLKKVSGELADVFIYGITMANQLGINLDEAIKKKIAYNSARFDENLFSDGNDLSFDQAYAIAKVNAKEWQPQKANNHLVKNGHTPIFADGKPAVIEEEVTITKVSKRRRLLNFFGIPRRHVG